MRQSKDSDNDCMYNEHQYFEALQTGDFKKLKELQVKNESREKKKYFKKAFRNVIKNKTHSEDQKIIQNVCQEKIDRIPKNLIVSFSELKIDKEISQGSYSVVFQGTYKYLPVAVKRITLQNLTIKEIDGILNELIILDRLKHPNIILALGFSMDDKDNLYIISQLYLKKNLKEYLAENKICLQEKIRILFEIARALQFMHSMDPPVLHRDIKPENVFISDDNSAILGDFGIAKEYSKDTFDQNTQTCSTLEFTSPETLNQAVYYKQSDIYSYGILMYEVITEKNFTNKYGYQFLMDIKKQYRPSLEVIENENLKDLIQICWQDEWQKRPEFDEICQTLHKIITNQF